MSLELLFLKCLVSSTPKDGMDADSQPQEPKETPMPSPETSPRNAPFGKEEGNYLVKISVDRQDVADGSPGKRAGPPTHLRGSRAGETAALDRGPTVQRRRSEALGILA